MIDKNLIQYWALLIESKQDDQKSNPSFESSMLEIYKDYLDTDGKIKNYQPKTLKDLAERLHEIFKEFIFNGKLNEIPIVIKPATGGPNEHAGCYNLPVEVMSDGIDEDQ